MKGGATTCELRPLLNRKVEMPDDENVAGDNPQVDTPDIPDISVFEAKIAELSASISERDNTISALTADLNAAKAANYDLLMAVPANDGGGEQVDVDVNDADADIDIDDLFESKD